MRRRMSRYKYLFVFWWADWLSQLWDSIIKYQASLSLQHSVRIRMVSKDSKASCPNWTLHKSLSHTNQRRLLALYILQKVIQWWQQSSHGRYLSLWRDLAPETMSSYVCWLWNGLELARPATFCEVAPKPRHSPARFGTEFAFVTKLAKPLVLVDTNCTKGISHGKSVSNSSSH